MKFRLNYLGIIIASLYMSYFLTMNIFNVKILRRLLNLSIRFHKKNFNVKILRRLLNLSNRFY